ncbi:hypothetical protein ABZT11_37550 [Streptomyces avermitilis]
MPDNLKTGVDKPDLYDLAQAHGGELGHLDFLQVLCQDEISGTWGPCAGCMRASP